LEISLTSTWQPDGLEFLGHCPVCGSTDRKTLYSDLIDKVFLCAPGNWQLYQCSVCDSGYLDPRPNKETIYLAYGNYYTHEESVSKDEYLTLNWRRKLRRRFVNGYTHWRYGILDKPSSRLGVVMAWLLPYMRRLIDNQYRYLPRPAPHARLLDVGFGNGEFLQKALSAGWEVEGVDLDATVVRRAKAKGLKVYEGSIEVLAHQPNSFDAITLSHVIEHVHDPKTVIQIAFDLLKPKGILYLETPNIKSIGHKFFTKNWLGLEPPRHLIIFGKKSLRNSLEKAGFYSIRFIKNTNVPYGIFKASQSLSHPGKTSIKNNATLYLKVLLAFLIESLLPDRAEFITVVARKG
jgi:2-polyprenyl-3-methyl-5-hydroxy-6-metoxy-1,4-benzoquinol methylase